MAAPGFGREAFIFGKKPALAFGWPESTEVCLCSNPDGKHAFSFPVPLKLEF